MNIIEELINYIKKEHTENSENILKNIGIQDLIELREYSNLSEAQQKEKKEDKFNEIIEIGLQKEL